MNNLLAHQPGVPLTNTPAYTADAVEQAVRERQKVEKLHVQKIASSVALAVTEALAGQRPVSQLSRWLDLPTFERIGRRVALSRQTGQFQAKGSPAHPVRCRVQRSESGSYESVVLLVHQKRIRAVALRIEQQRGMWRVSALDVA